jgi:hypothetical protein
LGRDAGHQRKIELPAMNKMEHYPLARRVGRLIIDRESLLLMLTDDEHCVAWLLRIRFGPVPDAAAEKRA